MTLFKLHKARQFNIPVRYQTRKNDESGIKFSSPGFYNPRAGKTKHFIYLAILIIAVSIYFVLGGFSKSVTPISVSNEDAVTLLGSDTSKINIYE